MRYENGWEYLVIWKNVDMLFVVGILILFIYGMIFWVHILGLHIPTDFQNNQVITLFLTLITLCCPSNGPCRFIDIVMDKYSKDYRRHQA